MQVVDSKRVLLGLSVVCFVLVSPTVASAVTGEETGVRLLVPAYGNPGSPDGPEMWSQLTETASAIGSDLVVILNPNSGPGASPIDPNYVNASGQGAYVDFRNAGGFGIGYVRTEWAERPLADVQNEIDLYFDPSYWRGVGVQIDGIFFDEMSNDLADVSYYETLRDYVRSLLPTAFVVGNPGTSFTNNPSGQSTWTVSDYAESMDLIVTFENGAGEYFDNYTPPSWRDDYSAERFGHIVYDVETASSMREAMALAKQRNAGYVYFTDDILENPYDVLASYWSEEVDAAQCPIFADGFESGDLSSWSP